MADSAVPQSPFEAGLLPASFRGVPFAVLGIQIAAGRRLAVHEYPFRDEPYTEDLGRKARRVSFSAFIVGDDVAQQALSLLNACQSFGPGLLVHPEYGARMFICEDVETEERWDKGRYVEFRLKFVEPGRDLYPSNAADTQAGTQSAADNAGTAAQSDFSARLLAAGGT